MIVKLRNTTSGGYRMVKGDVAEHADFHATPPKYRKRKTDV